jgi:transforming growth factor-beta-induced protein
MRTSLITLALIGLLAATHPAETARADSCCGGCGGKAVAAAPSKNLVETAVAAGSLKTLVAAVKAADLAETLSTGTYTVFAPADSAFAKLPEGTIAALLKDKPKLRSILTYHVIPGRVSASDVVKQGWLKTAQGQSLDVRVAGDEVRIAGARIVKADIETSNGIIHVIDSVVLPRKNIAETAAAAGTFKTLLAAAKAAGLVDALSQGGPFTVFAPSDAAFAKLPAGTVESLLRDKAKLKAVLTYHLVPGRVLSTDLNVGSTKAKTVQGSRLNVSRSRGGEVRANDAKVVAADILAGNGVIHVVDSVLIPR